MSKRKYYFEEKNVYSQNSKTDIVIRKIFNQKCVLLSIDRSCLQKFQTYVVSQEQERTGILLGKIDINGTYKVEVIFEPEQTSSKLTTDQKDDSKLYAIATGFDLIELGFILFSSKQVVTTEDLLLAVQEQDKRDIKNLIVVLLSSDKEDSSILNVQAIQVSNLLLEQRRNQHISSLQTSSKSIKLLESVRVGTNITDEIPITEFYSQVPIIQHVGYFQSRFPTENRNNPTTLEDLKKHLRYTKQNFIESLRDFHVIYFLCNYLDLKHDIPALCSAVIQQDEESLEGFRIIIESLLIE